MNYDNIYKNTFFYWFLKNILAKPLFLFFYHRYEIRNVEKIPKDSPVILAGNHQNALMDALAMLFSKRFQPVFVARADIFKKPLVIKILAYMKIMPIFRIRDGAKNLKHNDAIFDAAINILDKKINPFAILPEGNHGDKHRLRALQKGIFRIAFKAQEKYGEQSGIKIVPMGVNYDHYQKVHRPLFINYGDPIDVSDYYDEYQNDPAVAMNIIRKDLAEALKKLMIHIETDEYYQTYLDAKKIYDKKIEILTGEKKKNQWNRFRADKIFIDLLNKKLEKDPDWMKNLSEKNKEYQSLLKSLNIRDWVAKKNRFSFIGIFFQTLLHIILFPLFLLGLFNNYLIFGIPPKLTTKIKDPQFVSSVKYVIALILMMVWYPVLITLALIFIPVLWIKLVYIFTLPFTGIFAFKFYIATKKLFAKFRYSVKRMTKNKKAMQVYDLRKEIIDQLDEYILNSKNLIDHEVYR